MDFKVSPGFVVFWLCSAPFFAFAQQDELTSDNKISKTYSMIDGLPAEGINGVIQDKAGFIWLATYSGLCKYDGNKFTTYSNNPASSNSLRNNVLMDVYEDKKGRLWVGHAEGFDVFDPQTEEFILHWPDGGNVVSVQRFCPAKNGKIWICTSLGVWLTDIDKISPVEFPAIPKTFIWDVAETNDGSIWVAGAAGFYYLDRKSEKYVRYRNNPKDPGSPGSFGWRITIDRQDRVWLGTSTGLDLFNPVTNTFKHFLPARHVIDLEETVEGNLIVGSYSGLYLFNPGNKMSKVLASVGINFTVDKQGTIWSGGLSGLRRINPLQNKFLYREQPNQSVGSIVEDRNGNIWIQYQDYPSNDLIRSFFADRDGNTWRAMVGKLEKVNPDNQVVKTVTIPTYMNPITTFMDSQGAIWIGDFGDVGKYDVATDTFKLLTKQSHPFGTVYCFLEDSHKNVWIGSTIGLHRYNLITEKLDVFKNDPQEPQTMSSSIVFSLTQTDDGTIWLGTAGGLNKMMPYTENSTPKFINWRKNSSGLPNDDVYSIVDGGDGTLWMTCGNKISHFNLKEKVFRAYDEADGLSVKSFRGSYHLSGKGLRASDGKIYFGGTSLIVFHPDSLKNNSFVPPIAITDFSLYNQSVPVRGTDADTLIWKSPLSKIITYTDELRLSYDQNDFNFEFASLNYINPEHNLYKYKLEPYQKEWIATNAENRIAQYTNISPGTYTFRVIGSNNDGVWNHTGTSILIIITPPWWQTWWAYSLYVLAITAMFLYWRHYDIKRVKLKHRAEHLTELDTLKTRFFTNISHEFRTPITLIQGPLKEMYDKATSAGERSVIGTMLRHAKRLSRLINQLLDLSRLEAGKMTLHAAPVEVVQFLREIVSSYESYAAGKGINFIFYSEKQEVKLYIDVEKMEKVFHNLLSNAFKFTSQAGEVVFYVRIEGKHCVIKVTDTGIGIATDQLDKIFDRFYQVDSSQTRQQEGSGIGMALSKELVELHHGKLSVESVEGKGSTFTVRLLLGKEHFNKDEILEPAGRSVERQSSDLVFAEQENFSLSAVNQVIVTNDEQAIVLVVEDNADMRQYIRRILSDRYEVIESENGKSGVLKARENIPDLIISDVMMPEMDGYKFCEQIKTNELTSHIPVILLTAKADHQSRMDGLETRADDYLSKPFDADELKLVIRNRIEGRKKLRERFSREVTLQPRQISITSLDEQFLSKVLAIIEKNMDNELFSIDELSREVVTATCTSTARSRRLPVNSQTSLCARSD